MFKKFEMHTLTFEDIWGRKWFAQQRLKTYTPVSFELEKEKGQSLEAAEVMIA